MSCSACSVESPVGVVLWRELQHSCMPPAIVVNMDFSLFMASSSMGCLALCVASVFLLSGWFVWFAARAASRPDAFAEGLGGEYRDCHWTRVRHRYCKAFWAWLKHKTPWLRRIASFIT